MPLQDKCPADDNNNHQEIDESLLSPYILLAYSTSTYFYIILIYNQFMLFTSWEHWDA